VSFAKREGRRGRTNGGFIIGKRSFKEIG